MWDESLYGVRAKAIYYFNEWIDQTNYAVGGLYSSAHPPLFIWLTAISYKIFGVSEFATRFFSALFGSLTVILTYLITRNFFDIRSSLLAIPFIGSIYLFNFYSRQAQLDIPYIFFITLSFCFYLEFLKGKKFYLYLSSIAFGLSLMTKIVVGFFVPITLAIFLLAMYSIGKIKFKEIYSHLATLVSIGLFIALPWHLYMFITHGEDFINIFFKFHIIERLTEGVEENIPELGYFYILNQLIVQFPPSILVFVDLIKNAKNFKRIDERRILIHSWFWSEFFIISLSKTKIPSYVLPLFVPAVIISSICIKEAIDKKEGTFPLSLLIISLVWSSSQELRNAVKEVLKLNANLNSVLITTLFFFSMPVIFLVVKSIFKKLEVWEFAKFVYATAVAVGLFSILKTEFFIDYGRYVDGAEKICNFIDNSKVDTVLYLYTKHSTAGMNPQLTFYSYRKLSGSIKWMEIPRGERQTIKDYLRKLKNPIVVVERTARDLQDRQYELELTRQFLVESGFKELITVKRYILFKREAF